MFILILFLSSWALAQTTPDTLYQAPGFASAPTIDGQMEAQWEEVPWDEMNHTWLNQEAPDSLDFYGRYKVAWNPDALYLLVEVVDDSLSDLVEDPLMRYWADECVEIFIDENNDGGEHGKNHSAFAYHVSLNGDVVDMDIDGWPALFNDHIEVARVTEGDRTLWEMKLKVFDDTYVHGTENTPVTLSEGKNLGFSLAYCDNDGGAERDNFMGSVNTQMHIDNEGYLNADSFGTLELVDEKEQVQGALKLQIENPYLQQGQFLVGGISYEIYDVQGKTVHAGISVQGGLLGENLASGIYQVRLHTPEGIFEGKFSK